MATLISALETRLRREYLHETTASFWSSAELVAHIDSGIRDMWRATVDIAQEHYLTVDDTNVLINAAGDTSLTGVPTDVYKVYLIRPRDISDSSTVRATHFFPKDMNSDEFISAESEGSVDPSGRNFFYHIIGGGAPIGAPTIRIAPTANGAVNLRLIYIPTLGTLTASDNNPIPGESDDCLLHYAAAFALAKEREDAEPDPMHLNIYNTLKQNIVTSLTPRQVQEPDFVEAMFEGWS